MDNEFEEGLVCCPQCGSNLPVLTIETPKGMKTTLSALSACVTMENNQNLSVAQKELLNWHCRWGHLGFQSIQHVMKAGALGFNLRNKVASN